MRIIALAACVGLALGAATTAHARDWTDPAGRISFTVPNGWNIDPTARPTSTNVLAFDGSHDCYITGQDNPNTASASAYRVNRTLTTQFEATAWVNVANSNRDFFPDQTAQVTSQSVDTSGFWPIQRATIQSPGGDVYGAIQSRPGIDLLAFCRALGGANSAVFESVFASVSHPNDAAWRQQAEQEAASRAAAQAAPAPAPQQAEQEEPEQPREGRRRRRD